MNDTNDIENQPASSKKTSVWAIAIAVLVTLIVVAPAAAGLTWMWCEAYTDQALTDMKVKLYNAQLDATRAMDELEQTQETGAAMQAPVHDQMHVHEQAEVSADTPIPTLEAVVEKDAKSGWNVRIVTTNFVFSPDHASGEHVPGEGHAHVYVDGVKVGRVYGEWYHIDGYNEGVHTVRVTLNTNDHREYAVSGQSIESVQQVGEVSPVTAEPHDHPPGTPPHEH